MSEIRPHFLSAGDALDRRRLAELYLWAAKRLTEINGDAIANDQLIRSRFTLDAWEEYQTNFQTEIVYLTPEYGHQVPGSGLEIINDDSYFEAWVSWSLEVQVKSVTSFRVLAWPVVDGQALWHGEDWAEVDQLFTYDAGLASIPSEPVTLDSFTNGGRLSLGNHCAVQGLNGRSYLGILVASIGSFSVTKAQVNCRKAVR